MTSAYCLILYNVLSAPTMLGRVVKLLVSIREMPVSKLVRWTGILVEIAATCSRWFLARGFFYIEDGSDTFLRKVGSHKIYTAPHLIRRHSSCIQLDFIYLHN
jgi:hypothetical protein